MKINTTTTAALSSTSTNVIKVTNNDVDKLITGTLRVTKKMTKDNITFSVSRAQDNSTYRSHNFTGTLLSLKGYTTSDNKTHNKDGQSYDELLTTIDCATTIIIRDEKVGNFIIDECERIFAERLAIGNMYPTVIFKFQCHQVNVKPTNIIISNVTDINIDADTVLSDDAITLDNTLDQLLSNTTSSNNSSSSTVAAALDGRKQERSQRPNIISTFIGNLKSYF